MYNTILVPTDGTKHTEGAVAHGLGLAERYGATVHALYVVDTRALSFDEEGFEHDDGILSLLADRGDRATAAIEQQAHEMGVDAVSEVVQGTPARQIRRYAADNDVDLIAMGTRGRSGLSRYLLGSVAESVLRNATQPVLTAKEVLGPRDISYDRILLPTDGSRHAETVAEHAFDIAATYDATVHALSVIDSGLVSSRDILAALEAESNDALEAVKEQGQQTDVDVVSSVWRGTPHDCIHSYAADLDIDLIVLGAHERMGLDRFLSPTVATRVVRTASCPVCTIRESQTSD